MNQVQLGLSYQWQVVLLREKVEYLFPMSISPFMREKYKGPAVFKWEVYQKAPGDKKVVYIGEAQELCPKRLYSYLNPGLTQLANKKVNTEFRAYLTDKLNIRLDICDTQKITFGGVSFDQKILTDKYFRRLIVEMMIIEHRQRGFTVMDL